MRNKDIGLRFMGVVILLGLLPTAAMAYVDPGNGAYMVQVLFTLGAALLFYLRHPVQTFKAVWQWTISRRKRGANGNAASFASDRESVGHAKNRD